MSKQKSSFVTYRDRIPDVLSRFVFDHHAVTDPTGLIVTAQGFARPFYHKPTNTVGLLFSKTAQNLHGKVKTDGKLYATSDEAKHCYVISAYRCESDSATPLEQRREIKRLSKRLRNDLDNFCEELGERNQKHFTGFMTNNIFTNGRLTYEIVRRKNGRYKVVLSLPTVRKNGSFVPFDIDDKSLSGYFSRISKTIAKADTYEEAREALMKHWDLLSSELWDEKNIFKGKGKLFMGRKLMADFANATMHHALSFGVTMGVIGAGTTLVKPEYTIAAGLIGAVAHAAAHIAVEKSLETGQNRYDRLREARSRLDIKAYPHGLDVSDHFKIQTPEEIGKLCPHVDLQRFRAEEFELPDNRTMSLLRDRELLQSNLRATCLEGHLLYMHQRGFTSVCNVLDRRTDIRFFQSGIVRLMHEKANGNIVVYAQYRPDVCNVEKQRLPQHYIDQFDGGIVRLEYDRSKSTFTNGLIGKMEKVSYNDMVREVEDKFLYHSQPSIPWAIRTQAHDSVRTSFIDKDAAYMKTRNFYRMPPRLVDADALQPRMG